jgi:hypothetical protein
MRESLKYIPLNEWCVMAYDDTRLKKTGKKIQGAQYHRDPLSPRFHPNLMYGLRFLQCSILLPLHQTAECNARGIPIAFELAPCAKKPSSKASPEKWAEYRFEQTRLNLSVQFKESLARQRRNLDDLGEAVRLLLATVDGSFCNRKCLRDIPERVAILARTRKDAKLCMPAAEGTRRLYMPECFTPQSILKDETIKFEKVRVVYGGAERELLFKRVEGVLWRSGTKTRRLTLLILAPIPYSVSPNGMKNYRDPSFLICTQTGLPSRQLIQAYLDRWQIEVNHKDEKHILGVGQAQVWSKLAISRQPALAVAAYSVLQLAALAAYGPGRGKAFAELPKWRKTQQRPSLQDLLRALRQELTDPESAINQFTSAPHGCQNMLDTAAA